MLVPRFLTRLTDLLQHRRPAYHARLRPPATAGELVAFEAEFHLKLPPELRAWFAWHNGQHGFASFSPGGSLLSLAEVAEAMRINRELLADGDFVPNWWRPAWIPLLDRASSDYLCYDLEGTFTGRGISWRTGTIGKCAWWPFPAFRPGSPPWRRPMSRPRRPACYRTSRWPPGNWCPRQVFRRSLRPARGRRNARPRPAAAPAGFTGCCP